jgi:hypothetical protein
MRWGVLTKSQSFEWWTPYGPTEAEALENYRKIVAAKPAARCWTPEEIEAWHKRVVALRRPKYRRKPEGVPLTKTELKRQATKERIRAKVKASNEKHGTFCMLCGHSRIGHGRSARCPIPGWVTQYKSFVPIATSAR